MNAHGRILGVARETALTPATPSRQPGKPDRDMKHNVERLQTARIKQTTDRVF